MLKIVAGDCAKKKSERRKFIKVGDIAMKHLMRPYRLHSSCLATLAGITLLSAATAHSFGQARGLPLIFANENTQAAAVSQGYLGIDIADLDADKVQTLRLKDTHGAVITLIDHDAPAGQVGLKVNDVVLQLNGQAIDGADQFRRMLKEVPAGRKVTLEVSRDGSIQTFTTELVDRKVMEKNVWSKLGTSNSTPQMSLLGANTPPSGFHMPSFGSALKVGVMVEPLTSQMAAYLGVDSGLMVKQVEHKSEAETAGLHAMDVILKVGNDAIATAADWDRALRTNMGKPVQITIVRDKKQQTVTLRVDPKHHQGQTNEHDGLTPEEQHQLSELGDTLDHLGAYIDRDLAGQIAAEAEADAARAEANAQALRDRTESMHFGLSPEAAEQLRQQTEKLRESMKALKMNPKDLEDLHQQMEQFRKSFNPDQFRIDPNEMQEFQKRMDEFRQQMEEWGARLEGRFV